MPWSWIWSHASANKTIVLHYFLQASRNATWTSDAAGQCSLRPVALPSVCRLTIAIARARSVTSPLPAATALLGDRWASRPRLTPSRLSVYAPGCPERRRIIELDAIERQQWSFTCPPNWRKCISDFLWPIRCWLSSYWTWLSQSHIYYTYYEHIYSPIRQTQTLLARLHIV